MTGGTHYAGFVRTKDNRFAQAETSPHILVIADTGSGKTNMLASNGAVYGGPLLHISSRDDLLQMLQQSRYGKHLLLDFRKGRRKPYYPGVEHFRLDPTKFVEDEDDAVAMAEQLVWISNMTGGGGHRSDPYWTTQTAAALTPILLAASPSRTGKGVRWAIEAAVRALVEEDDDRPSWAEVARLLQDADGWFVEALREASGQDAKQRDSIRMGVVNALWPWALTSMTDPDTPVLDLAELDEPETTLGVLSTPGSPKAAAGIVLLQAAIDRQRTKTAERQRMYDLGVIVDEGTNIGFLRDLDVLVSEGRGLGVRIMFAVQNSEQLANRYGVEQAAAVISSFPQILLMYGGNEKDLLEDAARGSSAIRRRAESVDQATGRRTMTEYDSWVLSPSDLKPKRIGQARLFRRGQPGVMVELPEFKNFMAYYHKQIVEQTRRTR